MFSSQLTQRSTACSIKIAPAAWAMLTLAACVPQAGAVLIAADSFLSAVEPDPNLGQYITAGQVNEGLKQLRRSNANGAGQNPSVLGFSGAWTGNVTTGTSLAVAQWTAELEGIDIAQVPFEADGRARFAGVDNLQRRVQRELSPYAPSNVYYMSFSTQALTDEVDLDGFVGVGFTNTGATVGEADANIVGGSGLRGILIGASGNGTGTDFVVRHVGSSGAVQNDIILPNIVQNDPVTASPFVRYTIVKLEFNDDPGNPAGNSRLTVWQDPTSVASEAAASASVTPLVFRTTLTSNADLTHLTFTGVDYSRAVSFDEPRLATTWLDVVGVQPGDFNGDGGVDAADYTVWRDGLETAFTADDYNLWRANFGAGAAPAVLASHGAIPEPTARLLAALALVGGLGLRGSGCRLSSDNCA